MPLELSAERGMMFRITHVRNLPWLLSNGLPCATSNLRDPEFVEIGKPNLIQDRARRPVILPPRGTLADYVPFYLTPKSPMLLNIKTGWNGITQRNNTEIAILVSSVQKMQDNGVKLLFTDRHAYMAAARWSADPADLATMIDWDIINRHDFKRSDQYPDKKDRYMAEALAHSHVPVAALIGIGCISQEVLATITDIAESARVQIPIRARPEWFF